MAKDAQNISFNLDKIEVPESAKPQRFAYRGKTFQTVDLSELEYERFEKVWSEYAQKENPRPVVSMLLGKDAKAFWDTKPALIHVMALMNELEPAVRAVFGDPGESNDSATY